MQLACWPASLGGPVGPRAAHAADAGQERVQPNYTSSEVARTKYQKLITATLQELLHNGWLSYDFTTTVVLR